MKADLDRIEKLTRIDQADLVRACVEALIDYVDKHGEITMPLVVKPKSKEQNPGSYPLGEETTSRKRKSAA